MKTEELRRISVVGMICRRVGSSGFCYLALLCRVARRNTSNVNPRMHMFVRTVPGMKHGTCEISGCCCDAIINNVTIVAVLCTRK